MKGEIKGKLGGQKHDCEHCGGDITMQVRLAIKASRMATGRLGSLARMASLTPEQRAAGGRKAAQARWKAFHEARQAEESVQPS